VREEILLNGRILLLKGVNFRAVVEYTDHKKYNVETIIKFGETETSSPPQGQRVP